MLKNLIVIASLLHGTSLFAQEYYSGYAILQQGSYQIDDIEVPIYKSVTANTVLDGLNEILSGTGWRMADFMNADPDISRLLNQPYPDSKRHFNPMPLSQVLEMVSGNAWDLVVDPVNKLISFQLDENYRCFTMEEAVCSYAKKVEINKAN